MDVEKIWIYVVLAVIYGLGRLLKQNSQKSASAPQRQKPPAEPNARRRAVPERSPLSGKPAEPVAPKQLPQIKTFEELMREIMEARTAPSRQEPVIDYDEQIGDEERDLEDVNYDNRKDSEAVATYDRAKKEAFSRPSLEETMKVGDTVVSFGKFKEFERTKETNLAGAYLNDFRDMDKVRKAVVMSEILKPKF